MPQDLVRQTKICKQIAAALNLPCFSAPGWEADDAIATLACQDLESGRSCTIVSGDKDLWQLVQPNLIVYDYRFRRYFDEATVHSKLKVHAYQLPDYLGLVGDGVDSIPGVKGIGPKTAIKLLQAYVNLEAMYDDLDGVRSLNLRGAKRCANLLEAQRDSAFLSRDLARLNSKVHVERLQSDMSNHGLSTMLSDIGLSSKIIARGMAIRSFYGDRFTQSTDSV